MEKKRIDYILEYVSRELELSGLTDHTISSSTISLVKDLCNLTNCNPQAMEKFICALQRMVNMKPITPITENDFIEEEVDNSNGESYVIKRCIRFPTIYQDIDGDYYDDQAIIYKIKNKPELGHMCIYQGSLSSKKKISLPYVLNPEIIEIDEEVIG